MNHPQDQPSPAKLEESWEPTPVEEVPEDSEDILEVWTNPVRIKIEEGEDTVTITPPALVIKREADLVQLMDRGKGEIGEEEYLEEDTHLNTDL